MAWDRKAPFSANGNLEHYPQDSWDNGPYDPVTRTWAWHNRIGPEWRDAAPFRAQMTLEPGVISGRSAKYVEWRDEDGHRFPMFVAELVELVVTGVVKEGGVAEGDWVVCKRGQNYGIRYVRQEAE